MPILFKSKLSSAVANQTFVDKTQDDATVGKFALNNSEPESGTFVANPQAEINNSKTVASTNQSISGGGFIVIDTFSADQYLRVSGDGSAVTLGAQPLGSNFTNLKDGSLVQIVGTDAINTVSMNYSDTTWGFVGNGDVTLGRFHSITVRIDKTEERLIEVTRVVA